MHSRLASLSLSIALAAACADALPPAGGEEVAPSQDAVTIEPDLVAGDASPDPGPPPEPDAAVGPAPECVPGEPCAAGCLVGTCSAKGLCEDTVEKSCPEKDGNLCTRPACFGDGDCLEVVIENGLPPYATSECFGGAVCQGGVLDESKAVPTALAQECEAMGKDLDPFGCHGGFVCVGGIEKCAPVARPDGTKCWPAGGAEDGDTCLGHACQDGECTAAASLDVTCGDDDWPKGCGEPCRACSALTCHWIPDPAELLGNAKTKVRYCRPEAKVGAACDASPCQVDEVCAFDVQADGPLGKETLGLCGGGLPKSKETCLEELGKPALPCLLAGAGCDDAKGGCHVETATSDAWCLPPEQLCYVKSETFCTHLDQGEGWDPDTGCHVAWFDLDCDDANACTVDSCVGPSLSCQHQPLSGPPCDDGDLCTSGEKCDGGACAKGGPKCDDPGDVCAEVSCDPATGECLSDDLEGETCDEGDLCTPAPTCQGGQCLASGEPLECDDGNPCSDDFCDPAKGCQAKLAPDGSECGPSEAWGCDKGSCKCTPQCDGTQCGFDGCISSCACPEGTTCGEDDLCVATGNDLDGDWFVTADPSTQVIPLLGNATFVPATLDMTWTATTVKADAVFFTTLVKYSGTRTGSKFNLNATYTDPGGTDHQEIWTCTLQSDVLFTGKIVDNISLFDFPIASITWNVTGEKL